MSRSAVFVNSWPYSASNNVCHTEQCKSNLSQMNVHFWMGWFLFSPLRELALFLSTINTRTAAYSIYLFDRSLCMFKWDPWLIRYCIHVIHISFWCSYVSSRGYTKSFLHIGKSFSLSWVPKIKKNCSHYLKCLRWC